MQLHEIIEAVTKSGEEIKFVRIEDSEGDKNRGWQVDQIEAFIGKQNAGYLKMSYIPSERFTAYYPTIFNFVTQIKGKTVLPYKKQTINFNKLTDSELSEYWQYAYYSAYDRYPDYDFQDSTYKINGRPISSLTRKELLQQWNAIELITNKKWNKQLREFKNFHVDKPLVDYINVNQNFQRQRIGEALYKEGATWMAEKGMKLYASGLQSKQAELVWIHMNQKGMVRRDKRGPFVSA